MASRRVPLSIGSMETTAAVRLPALLADFHRRYPAVRLTLRTAPTADLVAAVLDGSLDGAFVAGPIEHTELASTIAFSEELVLVTAKRWSSLAALRAGTPESGPTVLVFRTGCTYRQRLEQMLTEFGWPSAEALRVRHAGQHDRLRRRRHGRDHSCRAPWSRRDHAPSRRSTSAS